MSESEQHKPKPWLQIDANGRFHWNIGSARRLAGMYCDGPDCLNHDDKENPTFKCCAKCKTATYCSKECFNGGQCQKKDWPSHKLSCGVEPVNGTFQKILQRFLTNPFLYIVFRMLTIYKHQLYLMKEDALNALRSKPFGLELFIQFEPADAKVLLKSISTLASKKLPLAIGSDKANEAVVAIPQIVAVSVIPEQEITRMEFTKWKGALEKAAGRSRDGKPPLQAVLRVSQWYGGEKTPAIKINTITTSLVIPDDSLRFARGQSLPLISALPYPVGEPCQDIAKLVEYTNTVLRGDDDDGWRLRTKLTRLDKCLVAFASAPSNLALREAVYRQLLEFPTPGGALQSPHLLKEISRSDTDFPILMWIDYLRRKLIRERIYRVTAEEAGYDFESMFKDILRGNVPGGQEVPEVPLDVVKVSVSC